MITFEDKINIIEKEITDLSIYCQYRNLSIFSSSEDTEDDFEFELYINGVTVFIQYLSGSKVSGYLYEDRTKHKFNYSDDLFIWE